MAPIHVEVHLGQSPADETKQKQATTMFWVKVICVFVLLGVLAWKFPDQALWIASKLFGVASAATKVAGQVTIKAAEVAVEAAESTKNAVEAELARRLIVKEALASLTPCSMLRCPSDMENIQQLLNSLKQAQHQAATKEHADMCAPIMPSDEDGRYLLATAAAWLIQQPRGHMPRSECQTTISSHGDTEETCKYETTLLPCSGAVKWPKLAAHLEEPFKIFNQRLSDKEAAQQQKHKEQLMHLLSAPAQAGQEDGRANRGELVQLMEEVLSDNYFVPATPRPSAVRVTPYLEEAEAHAGVGKSLLEKLEVLREDQKIEPKVRFCKDGKQADSAAKFCADATKLTKEKLGKAIEVIKAAQSLKLGR